MLLCHHKKLMFLTSVFTTLSYVAHAQDLTAKQIYSYAQNRDYQALENLGSEINIKDKNGNTALCLALMNDDSQAYQTLHKYGADITVKCNMTFGMSSGDSPYGYYPQGQYYPNGGYRPQQKSSGTFLGMGPVGWTVVGVLAVGGGIAAVAAGGGGGGGGSSSKKHSKNDDKVPVINPTDAEITDEDKGSAIIKKEISENGGANNGNVKVIVNSTSPVLGVSSSQTKVANALSDENPATAKIDIEQRGTGSVYGFIANAKNSGAKTSSIGHRIAQSGLKMSSYDMDDDILEAWNAYAKNGGNAKGQIVILTTNKADVYGLYGVEAIHNADAEGSGSVAKATIKISNSGNGNIYGIKNTLEKTYEYIANASSWDGTVDGLINIINTGNGNVYGIDSANYAYNTEIFAEDNKTSGKGIISIDNYGSGNVYGIKALKDIDNVLIDSYARLEGDSIGNGTASARVRLYNAGNGNSYGLYSPTIINNAVAAITSYERTGKEVADATGIVSLINKAKGNAYGLYSAGGTGEHKIYNTNSNYGNARTYDDYGYVGKALSTVEIANVGDGLAVGIYAKDGQIENSGNIKIHNLANGTAVGIYADGTTNVINSGVITIDRKDYVDDKATETTSDDRTYVAESAKGGKAVGIYGAKGSTIKNSGTIKINGAEKVYGIYTEGTSVINTGTIVIDGNSNHANAIKLNGGQLFQNGKVIAGADWGDGGHIDPDDGSATKYLDDEPITDKDNGHEIVGKTITENNPKSEEDYLRNANNGTIKKIVQSQSTVSGIVSESVSTFNALSFGGNKTADIIIAQRGSGDVYGIKGPQVYNPSGSTDDDDEDGINVHNAVFADFDEKIATGNVTGNITIRNTGAGTGNIYGIQVKAVDPIDGSHAVNALVESESSSASATGNILIENINSDKNVYAIYSSEEATNAESDENAKAFGYITINNIGNGNVFGIQISKNDNENANADATENGESTARIDINNKGNGNVYGMNANGTGHGMALYNAYAEHERMEEPRSAAKAIATINIENTGAGNVYGLKSLSDIYNAFSYYNSTAIGKIRIGNNGKGNAYGIFGSSVIKNASAHSYNSDYYATAKGYVNLLNKSSGNAYGLYSNTAGNHVMNNSGSDGETQISVIEMANIGNGLVVGMYSKDGQVENSGNIKIHNLADGTAVGIYADGTTNATNSGTIIIDRESYKDDMATDKTSDDVTYKAKSAKGGKAIGIYGSSGSNITNMTDGIIRINGASAAYGIYTEGGNVTNNGKIYIDNVLKTDQCMGSGCLSENHAIVLNGGKLFQNGVLYAEGTWYNPCQSVTCGANATCSVVGNSGVCQCNAGYEGNANTGCTLVTAENDEDVFGKETTKTIGRKIEGKDEYDGDGTLINYAYNNSDVKLNTNSADTVIGLRIISEESANAGKADTHAASVNVKQQGNGKVYGVRSEYTDGFDGWVYNALAEADTEISQTQNAKAVSTGLINVLNIGNGDMYGMSATQLTNACADAYIEESGQTADATATGRIHLVNNKSSSGNMYGMYGSEIMENAEAWSDEGTTAKAIGLISLVNKGTGYAYGMYARKTSTNVYNRSNKNTTSTIEIANVGSGMAVGMYAKDGKIDNSGDIKIHNLADGTAVGIYADGTTNASNSGTIIIDRTSYKDDRATDKTSDDVTYKKKSDKGGKAVGIYGAAGSYIDNSGTIKINGASTAYGIYTEGGSVRNTGTILIDGNSNHANAIRLNGGKLFQNGKIVAGADWNNNGTSGGQNEDDEEDLTDIDTGNTIIKKSLTQAYDVENVGVAGNNAYIKAVVDSRSAVIGINAPDDIEAGNAVGISTNKTASIDITQYGTGDVYGMRHRDLSGRGEPQDEDDYMDMYNAVGYNATGTIKIKDTGGKIVINDADDNGNIYGMYSNAVYMDLSNALVADDSSSSHTVRGTIEITAYGDNHVHGIYSQGEAVNAEGDSQGLAIGNINITNNGDGEVYGIETRRILYNAEATDTSNAEAIVTINNNGTGEGNVYGLFSVLDDVYNAKAGHEREPYKMQDAATAVGTVDIDNKSNGDVYGIRADQFAYNAYAYADSEATGTIGIKNKRNGNVTAIYAHSAANAWVGNNGNATGLIKIINNGNGVVKGMAGSSMKNARADTPGLATATIDIENYGTNDVYGIQGHYVVNARSEGHTEDDSRSIVADGKIIITNQNGGNVYGLDGGDDNIGVYNATASEKNAQNTGLIKINNQGNGNVYAMNLSEGEHENIRMQNASISEHGRAVGRIEIVNNGWGDVYGIRNMGTKDKTNVVNAFTNSTEVTDDTLPSPEEETGYAEGIINIQNKGDGSVIGLYSVEKVNNVEAQGAYTAKGQISITNQGNGNLYGIKSLSSARNTETYYKGHGYGTITLNNTGDGHVYGIYGEGENVDNADGGKAGSLAQGIINITNQGNGNVYGMYAKEYAENTWTQNGTANGLVRVANNGTGNAVGIYAEERARNASVHRDGVPDAENSDSNGDIRIINLGSGRAFGMYGLNELYNESRVRSNSNGNCMTSTIELANVGSGLVVGMYSKDGQIENSGNIKIHNLADGTAVGIYADGETTVTNSGKITIDRTSYKDDKATETTSDDKTYTADTSKIGRAYGIYGSANSNITNTADGVIEINGADGDSYGIYVENGGVVNNYGTIKINGNSSHANSVKLNGSPLFQNGILSVTMSSATPAMSSVSDITPQVASLNLNDFGGTVVASDTSQFIVEGAISGDLAINNNVIENGFNTTYSVQDMIQAGDTSGLNLVSQSALFDAKLENDTDAVMTMKAFNDVVENSSVADFLQNNYAENNNEDLFKALKSAETVAQLNSNIDDLFGKDMLSRMSFEDLSMMREISFDMNNRLFEKEGTFAIGENISPSGSDNHIGSIGRYSLNGFNNGKMSFGVGVSIADVRTGAGYNDNRRFDRNFMMSAPFGYKTHGFELITAPKMGYAYGTYDRKGFEGKTYDGKVQKRMFALMNEARYPVKFGSIKLIPSAEFNMIGYNIKGHENEQQYALRIKSQNHYSAEAGLGLMAQKEFKLYKNHKFNISGGVAVYHEFADPYELDVAMSGMSGTYRLHDEKRSDNRAVARFGFGYKLKDNLDISASLLENIDRDYRSDAKIDLNYHF